MDPEYKLNKSYTYFNKEKSKRDLIKENKENIENDVSFEKIDAEKMRKEFIDYALDTKNEELFNKMTSDRWRGYLYSIFTKVHQMVILGT